MLLEPCVSTWGRPRGLVHNLQIPWITIFSRTRFYNTRMPFKRWSRHSPTSSQARVLVVQASVAAYLQDLPSRFFPTIRATQENEKITTNEQRTRTTFQHVLDQEFFFGSRVAASSRDPSHWSIGSYVPFFTRKPHARAVPKRTTLRSKSSTWSRPLGQPQTRRQAR